MVMEMRIDHQQQFLLLANGCSLPERTLHQPLGYLCQWRSKKFNFDWLDTIFTIRSIDNTSYALEWNGTLAGNYFAGQIGEVQLVRFSTLDPNIANIISQAYSSRLFKKCI